MPDPVTLRDSEGRAFGVSPEDVNAYIAQGFTPETSSQNVGRVAGEHRAEEYGGTGSKIAAFGLGALSTATLGLSDVAGEALGAGHTLKSLREENPYATLGGELVGGLAPIGPAHGLTRVGRAIMDAGEGAGLAAKVGRGVAAGAVEGAGFGAGSYLTQVALEDKPLSAEGFVGAMGTGALFGAPIGGVMTAGEAALLKARSLFPRSQVTTEAARSVKQGAQDALSQSLADGDQMARAAERRIAITENKVGSAAAAEDGTRRMFGDAHPVTLDAQVAGNVEGQQVRDALQKYNASRAQLNDWIRNEADPELEAALSGLVGPTIEPGVASGAVPVGEWGPPGMRGYDPFRRPMTAEGTPSPKAPQPATTAFDSKDLGLTFDPETRNYLTKEPSAGPAEAAKILDSAAPAISIDSPIDKLSLDQLKQYQSLIDDAVDAAAPADQQAMFAKWGNAGKRIHSIESGAVKDPHPYGTTPPERFVRVDRAAGGSQGGSWYRDDAGQQWFGKHYNGDSDRLWSEHVANQIYRKMGVAAPETEIVEVAGKPMIMSKEITGSHAPSTSVLNATDIHRGFAVDAWLGNRDVLGAAKDNIVISGSKAHRIDAGGATIWRAQGDQKTFVQKVSELESMRSPSRSAGRVFGKLTPEDVQRQLADFSSMYRANRADIDHLIDSSGLSREVRDRIKVGLHDRAAWLETEAVGKVAPISNEEYVALAKAQHSKLSEAETNDLLRYSGSPLFREINSELKAGKAISDLSPDLRGPAANIEAAVARSAMPRDTVVYRGVNSKRSLATVEDLKPGDVYVDHGFGSTSREKDVAERLAVSGTNTGDAPIGPGVIMEISVPQGFPGLAMPSNTYGKLETEILLPRNARYIVTDVSRSDGGHKVIKMAIRQEESSATSTLTGQLRNMQSQLGKGADLSALGEPSRLEYAATKASKTKEAAEHFRAQANEKNYAGSRMAADEAAARPTKTGNESDEFFAGITRPKTRDAYVAANIGRAMREEGSHAAALAKVEREWKALAGDVASKAETSKIDLKDLGLTFDPESKSYFRGEAPKHDAGPAAGLAELLGHGPATPAAMAGPRRATLNSPEDFEKFFGSMPEERFNPKTRGDSHMPTKMRESMDRTLVDSTLAPEMAEVSINDQIERALAKHNGKNKRLEPDLGRAARAIGDYEAASADLVEILGPEAPASAVAQAKAYRSAVGAQADASGASMAKATADIDGKLAPAIAQATGGKTAGALGAVADVGTALEVLKAMGVHTPALSAIPVIGPILGLFFKARAVMGILGRKGGSVGRSVEGVVAAKSAATMDRFNAATVQLLEAGARGTRKAASYAAGPAVTLGNALFPGGEKTSSKNPYDLYHARMDELARALQPGAIAHAIGDRVQTSDPTLQDAVIAQVERAMKFLDSKAPKQTVLPGMMPGDGVWHPSKSQIEQWGKYVHAVNDPASVLEDLAKGHISMEGAETLRVVYPLLFAQAQRILLEKAPEMQKTLPYSKRVAISIMYQIPVDGTMTPRPPPTQPPPMQGAQALPGQTPPQAGPALTGPLQSTSNMSTSLDRRAGA